METEDPDGPAGDQTADSGNNVIQLPRRWQGPLHAEEPGPSNDVGVDPTPVPADGPGGAPPTSPSYFEWLGMDEFVPLENSKPSDATSPAADALRTVGPSDFWDEGSVLLQSPLEGPRQVTRAVDEGGEARRPAAPPLPDSARSVSSRSHRLGGGLLAAAALSLVAAAAVIGLSSHGGRGPIPIAPSGGSATEAALVTAAVDTRIPAAVLSVAQRSGAVAKYGAARKPSTRPRAHTAHRRRSPVTRRSHRSSGGGGYARVVQPQGYSPAATSTSSSSRGSRIGSEAAPAGTSSESSTSSSRAAPAGPQGPGAPFGPGSLG